MKALGIHLLAELCDCDAVILNSINDIETILISAAIESGATVLNHMFHKFSPQGVSGVIVIAESHIAIHTWPEFNYAAVDVFTCGKHVNPYDIIYYIEDKFSCQKICISNFYRTHETSGTLVRR